jgi:hypothetical protein
LQILTIERFRRDAVSSLGAENATIESGFVMPTTKQGIRHSPLRKR